MKRILSLTFGAVMILVSAGQVRALASATELKAWPATGAWHTSLARNNSNGELFCLAASFGRDPYPFAIGFMHDKRALAISVVDANEGLRGGPEMGIFVDGSVVAKLPDRRTGTARSATIPRGPKGTEFLTHLLVGNRLTIDLGNDRHSVDLTGFAPAVRDLMDCLNIITQQPDKPPHQKPSPNKSGSTHPSPNSPAR